MSLCRRLTHFVLLTAAAACVAPAVPAVAATGTPGPLRRPASAVTVRAGTLTWQLRESFVQYLASGEGTRGSAGATALPASVGAGSDAKLVYAYRLTFAAGWYDRASGRADLHYRGTVRFLYREHTIDLSVSRLEVQLDGARSRVLATIDAGGAAKPERGVLVALAPAKAIRPAPTPGGPALALITIPASITKASGSSVFAGYYLPGDPFGSFSLSASSAASASAPAS